MLFRYEPLERPGWQKVHHVFVSPRETSGILVRTSFRTRSQRCLPSGSALRCIESAIEIVIALIEGEFSGDKNRNAAGLIIRRRCGCAWVSGGLVDALAVFALAALDPGRSSPEHSGSPTSHQDSPEQFGSIRLPFSSDSIEPGGRHSTQHQHRDPGGPRDVVGCPTHPWLLLLGYFLPRHGIELRRQRSTHILREDLQTRHAVDPPVIDEDYWAAP